MMYTLGVLIALDQLVNALLGGWPDETISARAFRSAESGKLLGRACVLAIDALFWVFEKRHCEKAFAAEVRKLQLPDSYRN